MSPFSGESDHFWRGSTPLMGRVLLRSWVNIERETKRNTSKPWRGSSFSRRCTRNAPSGVFLSSPRFPKEHRFISAVLKPQRKAPPQRETVKPCQGATGNLKSLMLATQTGGSRTMGPFLSLLRTKESTHKGVSVFDGAYCWVVLKGKLPDNQILGCSISSRPSLTKSYWN